MIDELQRVKDFGTSEPPPSETARNAARSALARAIADAERQHQPASAPVHGRRPRWYARAPRLLPIGAAVAVAAAAALFVTAPWSSSPGFLARAEAALTPPKNMILHAKLTEPTPCSVRWTAQIWVDEHTDRYRGLFHDPFLPYPFRDFTLEQMRAGLCTVRASTYEAGVVLGPPNVCCGRHNTLLRSFVPIRFVPPNKLIRFPGPGFTGHPRGRPNPTIFGVVPALDPAAELRDAIRSGRARDQGKRTLNGRTVERIRFDPCHTNPNNPDSCPDPLTDSAGYAYVDPETYYPVEIRFFTGDIIRFAKYEYLPRTATNLALTNIRKQHPHARLSG